MRFLVLLTDGFGGRGGIALYNRDLLTALCSLPVTDRVVAVPRLMPAQPEQLAPRLTWITDGIKGKFAYAVSVARTAIKYRPFNFIICSHVNLLPLAVAVKKALGIPLVLVIYGIDVWQPTKSRIVNALLKKIDAFISISDFTRTRFLAWSGVSPDKGFLLPNAIHASTCGVAPRNSLLAERYGLNGRKLIITMGRMSADERYKGFDEVLDLLPGLAEEVPDISYMIVGDGTDRKRLEEKAKALGVSDRVIFTGYIPEAEKADHYRLADAFVMPGRGEGFGFVFLEAMACGVPVVASKVDGSREAIRDGKLGILVNPDSREELKAAILRALKQQKGVPEGLDYFSYANFEKRLHGIIDDVISGKQGLRGKR